VFGDPLGRPVKSVREAWITAAKAAGLEGFQLRDLRHESACRFEEAGTLVSDVSKLLGHTSLTTTSRYLMNSNARRCVGPWIGSNAPQLNRSPQATVA